MKNPAYLLEDVSVRFGRRTVLDSVSFGVNRGEILGLLGPNGAGKTTLLKVLALLQPPSAGGLRFCGDRVDFSSGNLTRLRRRVVLVQQDPLLFSTSVGANVALPLRLRGAGRAEREQKAREILRLVGMEAFLDARADTLSGGETQRVAIAMALACKPEVILFDEPTSSVDRENIRIVERMIGTMIREQGVTVLFSTHEQEQARRLADRTAYLSEGRLLDAPPENMWRVVLKGLPGERASCSVDGTTVLTVATEVRGPALISIAPRHVRLQLGPAVPKCANLISGTVRQLADEGDRVRVEIQAGVRLHAVMAAEEFRALDLNIGKNLGVSLPPEHFRVWPNGRENAGATRM